MRKAYLTRADVLQGPQATISGRPLGFSPVLNPVQIVGGISNIADAFRSN